MNKKKILVIQLSGKKTSGKTTVANTIVNKYKWQKHIFIKKYSYANGVKSITHKLLKEFKIDKDKHTKEKIRPWYQLVGNIAREQIDINYWIEKTYKDIIKQSKRTKLNIVVIDDARFPNEMNFFDDKHNVKVLKIRITRKDHINDDKDISETALDNYKGFNMKLNDIFNKRESDSLFKIIDYYMV